MAGVLGYTEDLYGDILGESVDSYEEDESKDEFKYSRIRTFEHFGVQFNYFLRSTESNFKQNPSFKAKMAFFRPIQLTASEYC